MMNQVSAFPGKHLVTLQSNQKYPRCKKGRPRTKTGLAEKDVKSNGQPCLLVLIGLKVLVMMNSLQNIVISGA